MFFYQKVFIYSFIYSRKRIDYMQFSYKSYKGRAKSSVTNRLPKFYPSYILKCFTALEWCVE